jgi:hypothetical protein
MLDFAQIGLILIALAWVVQLVVSLRGNVEIRPSFIILYMLGVLGMVVADYRKTSTLSYFEALTFIAAGALLVRIFVLKGKKREREHL